MLTNLRANALDLTRAAVNEILTHLFPGAAVVTDETTPRRDLCVAPGRPHTATDGLLCRDHLQELATWLHDIETEAKHLDPTPSMQTRLGQGGGGSLASHQAPVVLDAVVYRDRRTTAHGHQHIGPVCNTCPTLAGRRCNCPPLPWRRTDHWADCPRCWIHPSCLNILADIDEHDARAERLLSVYAVLHALAQRVRDERTLDAPTRHVIDRIPGARDLGPVCALPCTHTSCQGIAWHRDIPARLTVRTERTVLTRHLDWIATQPWVTAMRTQLAELRTQLRRHNGNADDRPLSGYCYRLVDDQGTECRGNLLPAPEPVHSTGPDAVTELADGPHRPRAVVCEKNPAHRWEGRDLARLSLILERQARDDAPARPTPPPAPADRRLRVVYDDGRLAGDRLRSLLAHQDDAS